MNDWARVMLTAGLEAGKEVMDIYESGDVGVEYKEDSSPLTRADRASHQIIMHHLETTGIPVLSEEGKQMPFESRASWKKLWIVDPIDGRRNISDTRGVDRDTYASCKTYVNLECLSRLAHLFRFRPIAVFSQP